MSEIRITKLERDEDGFWQARVTPEGGETYQVHCRFGSWMRNGERPGWLKDLPKTWTVALQMRVRRLEARELAELEARRSGAVASGRCEVRVRGQGPRASRALIAAPSRAGRARVQVHDRSRTADAPAS